MRVLALCFFLFINGLAEAQELFYKASLKETLEKAGKEGKLVFLQFESAHCNQCNEVADKGLEDLKLRKMLQQHFVCIKIDEAHADRDKVATFYNIDLNKGFGSFFLDPNGTLLHTYLKTTDHSPDYFEQVDIALSKAGESSMLKEMEAEYRKGNKSFGFLQALVQKRTELNLTTDQLLDELITALPPDSLKSEWMLQFILQQFPLLDSRASRVIHQDRNLFDRAWFTMDNTTRSRINRMIIYKTLEKAIRNKDENLAMRTCYFSRGVYINKTAGERAFQANLVHYYEEINDTLRYFLSAIDYNNRYLMNVSVDSIKKVDVEREKKLMEAAVKQAGANISQVKVTLKPAAEYFARNLNNAAYNFYRKTNNPTLLALALSWSKQSLEFFETAESYDTYAKLLYKQGRKSEAIEAMIQAIQLRKKRGYPTKTWTDNFEKMKAGAIMSNE